MSVGREIKTIHSFVVSALRFPEGFLPSSVHQDACESTASLVKFFVMSVMTHLCYQILRVFACMVNFCVVHLSDLLCRIMTRPNFLHQNCKISFSFPYHFVMMRQCHGTTLSADTTESSFSPKFAQIRCERRRQGAVNENLT